MRKPRGPTAPLPPPVIEPNAVYTAPQLRALLGLPLRTIRTEVGAGRLRVAKRCRRYYFLGAWVLEWIRSGEISLHRAKGAVQEEPHRAARVTSAD